jgi:hypothetical protein
MNNLKNISIVLFISLFGLIGCGNKSSENLKSITTTTELTKELSVGNQIKPIKLKDQFDKPQTITNYTKKIIFVFTKNSGHQVRELLNKKPNDYLSNSNIAFVADIHKMPSFIANMIAIPDLQKHKYPIMLIREDESALPYLNETYKEYITIVTLENMKITDITLISDAKELDKLLK